MSERGPSFEKPKPTLFEVYEILADISSDLPVPLNFGTTLFRDNTAMIGLEGGPDPKFIEGIIKLVKLDDKFDWDKVEIIYDNIMGSILIRIIDHESTDEQLLIETANLHIVTALLKYYSQKEIILNNDNLSMIGVPISEGSERVNFRELCDKALRNMPGVSCICVPIGEMVVINISPNSKLDGQN